MGEAAKTETLAIRLDPKSRYMLEIASRVQHRSLSSVVEWMINNSMKDICVDNETLLSLQSSLWDVDESDRMIKLAFHYPSLLSFEDQKIWKLIRECGLLWKGEFTEHHNVKEWIWTVSETNLLYNRVRQSWNTIKKQAGVTDSLDDLFDYEYSY